MAVNCMTRERPFERLIAVVVVDALPPLAPRFSIMSLASALGLNLQLRLKELRQLSISMLFCQAKLLRLSSGGVSERAWTAC